MTSSFNIPSPIQKLESSFLMKKGISLYIKRDDLIHPVVSGNKWRKLKYNIFQVQEDKKKGLVTFGGNHSNHIIATAWACAEYKIPSVGIITGNPLPPSQNNTLEFAKQKDMQLFYIPKGKYRNSDPMQISAELGFSNEDYHMVPEGGANALGIQGCMEIMDEIKSASNSDYSHIVLSAGTGTTAAGILKTESHIKILIVSALKGDFLKNQINQMAGVHPTHTWELLTDYHFGGYAKYTEQLISFINEFKLNFGIGLDPIYNGKTMYAIYDLIKKNKFPSGSQILFIHTGGMQGVQSFNDRFGNLLI